MTAPVTLGAGCFDEPGCSIGVFSRMLAQRCEALLR